MGTFTKHLTTKSIANMYASSGHAYIASGDDHPSHRHESWNPKTHKIQCKKYVMEVSFVLLKNKVLNQLSFLGLNHFVKLKTKLMCVIIYPLPVINILVVV